MNLKIKTFAINWKFLGVFFFLDLWTGLLTDQTTEATISKFGSGVLYSIRMKMGIIKSVLIKGFILKKNFFLYQLCILKIGFVLIKGSIN